MIRSTKRLSQSKPNSFARSFARSLACAGAILVCTPMLQAQSLPGSTVEAISISSSHKTQINEFVSAWSPKVMSDKAQDAKKGIEAITKPLHERSVSVAFRQAYAQSLSTLINELQSLDTVGASLASLRIAGDLGTPSAATMIQSAITNSDDKGVQLFAVSRAGQIFTTTATYGPAMTPNDAVKLISAIESLASGSDVSNELLSACVRSLSIATALSSKDMGDTRSSAIVAMANIVSPQLRSLAHNDDTSFAHELALIAASASTASISDISSETNADAVKAAVGLGGDIISVSLRQVFKDALPMMRDRTPTIRAIQAGETVIYFALRKDAQLQGKSPTSVNQTDFANQLAQGKDRAFRGDASSLLGAGSPIVTRFGFADGRFLF